MLGTQVRPALEIRAARPEDDEERVGLFLRGLSRETLAQRFFVGLGVPGAGLVRAMVARDERRDALLALHGDVVIGHAMSHLSASRLSTSRLSTSHLSASLSADGAPGVEAEIAVVVDDRWQGLGVGSLLVRTLLRRASVRGAVVVGMDVLAGNRRVLAMVRRAWPSATITATGTSVEIKAPLAFAEQGSVGSPLTM
ncbi:N-acetyltransferase family protein [Microbispora sp. CA-135349]|uniref:GNAT family N-acetyltransferase n=1 Tax=Microbispora sp. CA-135349 TaxID=3239953 RepID=UPI003D8EE148